MSTQRRLHGSPCGPTRRSLLLGVTLGLLLALVGPAGPGLAKNHQWKFSEFFSNADGTIQFIEMQECCGSDEEVQMAATPLTSDASVYYFPLNLPGPTAHHWILIATPGFAALPGAPTPDYIIPAGFFDPTGDTLRYRSSTDTFAIAPGALPLDGVNAIHRDPLTYALTVGANSPTNFAGETGSVNLSAAVPSSGPLFGMALVAILAGLGVRSQLRRVREP